MHIALPLRLARPSFWRRFSTLLDLYRQRQALRRMDQHMLDDIGLTRHQAEAEAERPIWDAPQGWRQ